MLMVMKSYNMFRWDVEKFFIVEILLLNVNGNKILGDRIVFIFLVFKSRVTMISISIKMTKTLVNLSINLDESSVLM